MSLRFLIAILCLPSFTFAADLGQVHSCLMQAHAATGRPANSYAFVLKSGEVAYISNAAQILRVTSPKADSLPQGDVNIVSSSGYKSYVRINDDSVTAYAGAKENLPEIHVKVADKIGDYTMAEMIRDDIMNALKRPGVDIASAKARIYRSCSRIPFLQLSADWEQNKKSNNSDSKDGSILDDVWGDGTGTR